MTGKYSCSALFLLILLLLPFFGGAESATGLFLVHSLILLLCGVLVGRYHRLRVPRFLVYFLPLVPAYLLSTLFAPYRYGAALEFWDLCVAGIFAVATLSTLGELESDAPLILRIAFLLASACLLLSSFLPGSFHINRLTGTFVNPNDFAAFSLLVALLGFSLYGKETTSLRKNLLLFLTIAVFLCVALALSRAVFLASVVIFALYIIRRKPGRIVSIALVTLLALGGAFLAYRVARHPSVFQYYRFRIWSNTLRAVREDPYFGIGPKMLPYYASRIAFPADVEVGRFARLATTADNQYVQYLAETGFVGLLCFLSGWVALYFTVKNQEERFFSYLALLAISVIAFFSLPLSNTSILFLLLLLIIAPLRLDVTQQFLIPFKAAARWLLWAFLAVVFLIAVLLPYWADREFKAALSAKTPDEARRYQTIATRLNPYQPYYIFRFIEPVINSRPDLDASTWQSVLPTIDHLIKLNPLEPDFYVAKARVLRILYDKTGQVNHSIEAASAYQEALHCAPTNVFLHSEFADFEKHIGHYNLAIATMRKVVDLEPAFINARYMLAELHFRISDVATARKDLEEASALAKRYANYPLTPDEKYARRLLTINASYRQRVEDLVFGHEQN